MVSFMDQENSGMNRSCSYLMESLEETLRLEIKTDPETIRKQAHFCGLKPGLRVLDAGCGIGKTTYILHKMCQPGGRVLGIDYSEERIQYARKHYDQESGINFKLHDIRDPLAGEGLFDLIWIRFVLEYYRVESRDIIRNLAASLKPGGYFCLLDLDHNCLNHYELPGKLESTIFELMSVAEKRYNFDPYAGRKLYASLYDLGYENIQVDLRAHHLIYGKIRNEDIFTWFKKLEIASNKAKETLERYPGGSGAFVDDFFQFFNDPRRFTYTPLIICKGMKPLSSSNIEDG